jgi:two-component system cell cycle response regulator
MRMIDPEQELEELAIREQKLDILVVDDSPVYHKLVSDALYYQPYSILRANSGKEALDLFAKHAPPIVITDWMMPDLNGPDLCKRIRSESQAGYTYIILLTSMSDNESLLKGLEAGADEFLTKPFDPAELQARLGVGRRIVQLHRQIDAKDKQIEGSSRIDPVTGFPNHRAIQEWATWQLTAAAQNGFPAWVVLADVDSFGEINEKFGREAGDTVLKEFAQIMRDISRPADICGRVGDDELVCVLTHASKDNIAAAIERYRIRFAEHEFRFGEKIVTTTASFGAVGFEGGEAPPFARLVLEAEKALNTAKQAGGNQYRIVTAPETKSGA